MTEDEVRKVVEELLAKGEKPSVRKVRTALGDRGSHTDLGPLLRKILEDRDRLNAVRNEMPQEIRDKLDLLAADFWNAAQINANRAVEDAERGAAARIALAEEQADELAKQADELEFQVANLTAAVKEKDETIARLQENEEKAKRKMAETASKMAAVQAKLRMATEHIKKRDTEFGELCNRLDAAFKKAS